MTRIYDPRYRVLQREPRSSVALTDDRVRYQRCLLRLVFQLTTRHQCQFPTFWFGGLQKSTDVRIITVAPGKIPSACNQRLCPMVALATHADENVLKAGEDPVGLETHVARREAHCFQPGVAIEREMRRVTAMSSPSMSRFCRPDRCMARGNQNIHGEQ